MLLKVLKTSHVFLDIEEQISSTGWHPPRGFYKRIKLSNQSIIYVDSKDKEIFIKHWVEKLEEYWEKLDSSTEIQL